MQARERWQALQAHLTAARAAADAGDRVTALTEVAAALELDPEFLAAHSLREHMTAMDATSHVAPSQPAATGPVATDAAAPHPAPSGAPSGYAKFEQRVRRRRVDRRIAAARAAIEQQRLKAAAAALDEIIDLDPNLPELVELTAQFDELRRSVATPHRGPWIAAAAVFAGALLGGSGLNDPAMPILARQFVSAAPLPAPRIPILTTDDPAIDPAEPAAEMEATGPRVARIALAAEMMPAPSPARVLVSVPAPVAAAQPPRVADAVSPSPLALRLASVPVDTRLIAANTVASPPASATLSTRPDAGEDEGLIKQVLQRYRTAYEGLDAHSARVVWPAVNEIALARAFDGLESQSLTFEACDVRVRGEAAATAVCRGSARYVPKIGSRDPRTEPRVWNFTLRKAGTDWTIDSARADR